MSQSSMRREVPCTDWAGQPAVLVVRADPAAGSVNLHTPPGENARLDTAGCRQLARILTSTADLHERVRR